MSSRSNHSIIRVSEYFYLHMEIYMCIYTHIHVYVALHMECLKCNFILICEHLRDVKDFLEHWNRVDSANRLRLNNTFWRIWIINQRFFANPSGCYTRLIDARWWRKNLQPRERTLFSPMLHRVYHKAYGDNTFFLGIHAVYRGSLWHASYIISVIALIIDIIDDVATIASLYVKANIVFVVCPRWRARWGLW